MVTGSDYISKKLVGQRFDGTKPEHSISHAYEIVGIGLDGKIEIKYLDEDMPTFERIEWAEFLKHKKYVPRGLNRRTKESQLTEKISL